MSDPLLEKEYLYPSTFEKFSSINNAFLLLSESLIYLPEEYLNDGSSYHDGARYLIGVLHDNFLTLLASLEK